jgi:hypothetical protein
VYAVECASTPPILVPTPILHTASCSLIARATEGCRAREKLTMKDLWAKLISYLLEDLHTWTNWNHLSTKLRQSLGGGRYVILLLGPRVFTHPEYLRSMLHAIPFLAAWQWTISHPGFIRSM